MSLSRNGSGKSSLLRIIAGEDTDYSGEISKAGRVFAGVFAAGAGFGNRETVIEIVSEGVRVVDLLAEFDKINEEFGDPMRISISF